MKSAIRTYVLILILLLVHCIGYSQVESYLDYLSAEYEGSTFVEDVYSPSLEGNLQGNPSTQAVKVYLPHGYEYYPDNTYPVVYLLHGYTEDHNSFFQEHGLKDSLDQMIGDKSIAPMIFITPNGKTVYDGSCYTDSYVFKDKLPITINIGSGYQIEDKIPISLRIFKQQAYLGGYIVGEYRHSDMPASITATWLEEYSFDNTKSREIVYDLNHARQVNWYEVVEMYFKSMVPEYFYVGAGSSVYKTNRLDRWVLDISSYIPEGMALNIRRKLHRVKNLYDLTDFNTLDEAIRFAIDYVTSYNYGNLGAYLNVIPKIYHTADLPVRIRWFTPTNDDLSATITPQEKTFVLGFDDKVEFI